jgi:CubicO group peptidase (beta-lactamase class C family)
MKPLIQSIALALLILAGAKSSAQAPYYPADTWEQRFPVELGLDMPAIDSAVYLAQTSETKTDVDLRVANEKAYANEPGYRILGPMRPRGGPAGVILHKGYIVAQWGDVERVDMTFSVAKSYLSTVAGLAVDDRLIRGVNDPVAKYVWEEGLFDGPHNGKITWKHLLQQNSDWSGCLWDICDWADRPPREGTIEDWKNRTLQRPGTVYEYNDVRVNLLAYALLQVFRKPLPMVLKERIMDPIGASTTWRWYGYENSYTLIDGQQVQSVSGGGHFGGGLFINTLDHARFGLLMLRDGKWKDKQLISPAWIREATQPSASNSEYGYLWWVNADGHFPRAPQSAYAAEGFGGNYVIILPEQDMVVVARWLDGAKINAFLDWVLKSVPTSK